MIDRRGALRTRTERPKIIIRVDAGTVTIVPVKLYRVVPYRPNVNQLGVRYGDKLPAGAVPLAESARTISAQVRFWIDSRVVIIPQDPDNAICFDMIDLGWNSASHAAFTCLHLKFNQTVTHRRHATNLCAIH